MPLLRLLPLLLPRVRLLPPLLRAPDPAAAQARASSSLPKICNLRVCPAHAAARHRYRSNLTPAAGLAPPPPQAPPPGPGLARCRPSGLQAGGRRDPGRACPSPGRPRSRHCGARWLAGPQGLCGRAAAAPLLWPSCVTPACFAGHARSAVGAGTLSELAPRISAGRGMKPQRGLCSVSGSSCGIKDRVGVGVGDRV